MAGKKIVSALLFVVMGSGLLGAQVLDRGELSGAVRDETGAALPGVTVTVTQVETGLTRVVTTDGTGRYRAPLLPVGSYTIRAELAGFATVTREGVVVTVGSAPVIDLTMPLATVTEAITVSATSPVVEIQRAVVSTTLNQKAIATLPINGRDFRDFALLAPGVQQTPGLRSPLRFGGQQGDYSMLSVDGADMTNPFFAEYTGSLETKNFAISQEAVQEFEVLTNGFNAEFGRSTGGVINVVTKSGTNELRGGGFAFFRASAMKADDPFGNPSDDFDQQQFGASIGGPIKKDKAFFFLAFDAQNRDDTVITRFSRNVSGVSVPEYGITNLADLEGPNPDTQDLLTLFGKVDFDLSRDHRLSVRLNRSDNDTTNFTGGRGQSIVGGAAENFEDFTNTATSLVASLTSVIGTRAFNEFKFHYIHEIRPREAKSDQPEVQIGDVCGFSFPQGGCFGREFFLPITGDNNRIQFTDSFSYLFGSHDVKFGVDWNSTELTNNAFIGWSRGSYWFLTLEDFQARQPFAFIFRQFFEPFGEDNATTDDYWTNELGLFIQDKWQAKPNLTISYGLRYEAQFNGDPKNPIANPDGVIGSVRQAPGTDLISIPQTIASDTNNLGPRLGISWDPTNDGKTVVRGGAGIYFGRTATIFMPTGGAGFRDSTSFFFPPPAGLTFPETPESVIPVTPGLVSSVNFVSPDFQNLRVLNTNVGVEREIVPDLSAGADFIYSRTENARIGGFNTTFDQNTFAPTGTDQYGRPIGVDVFTRGRPSSTVFQADMLSSLGRARYKAVTVKVKKGFSERTQFLAHYTWSKDESNADPERDIGFTLGPSNAFDLEGDFGIDERDITHRFVFQGTAELGRGFTLSGLGTYRSGLPIGAFETTDVNGDGNTFDRPVDANGNIVPRFPERQPSFFNVDMRVMWTRNLGSAGEIDLLFEIFNLFNNDNFRTTNFSFPSAGWGLCGADPNPTNCDRFDGVSREAQIGIKWRFGS
jgi:outer membrane receptor for ferrienterochelin and colicin